MLTKKIFKSAFISTEPDIDIETSEQPVLATPKTPAALTVNFDSDHDLF